MGKGSLSLHCLCRHFLTPNTWKKCGLCCPERSDFLIIEQQSFSSIYHFNRQILQYTRIDIILNKHSCLYERYLSHSLWFQWDRNKISSYPAVICRYYLTLLLVDRTGHHRMPSQTRISRGPRIELKYIFVQNPSKNSDIFIFLI